MQQLRFLPVVELEADLAEEIAILNRRSEMACRNYLASELPAEEPRFKVTRLLVGKTEQTLTKDGLANVFYVDQDAPPLFDVEILKNQPDPKPYEPQLMEMGCEVDYDPRVDYEICQHNAVVMRELVFYGVGGVPYALRMRGRLEAQRPKHADPRAIHQKLGGDYIDSDTVAHTIRRFGLNRHHARRLMGGYLKDDRTWAPGFSKTKTTRGVARLAAYLEHLADEVEETASEYTYEDARREAYEELEGRLHAVAGTGPRFKYADGLVFGEVDAIRQMGMIERLAQANWEDHLRYRAEAANWQPLNHALPFDEETNFENYWRAIDSRYEDDLDGEAVDDLIAEMDPEMRSPRTVEDPVFTARSLCDGTEAMGHEFLTFLRFASLPQLKRVREKLSLYRNRKAGKKLTGDEWQQLGDWQHMTASQIAQTWQYVKDREHELTANITLSAPVVHTLNMIRKEGATKRVKAYALSHMNGRSFNDHGRRITFQRPTDAEAVVIFNTLFANKRREVAA